MSKDPRQTGRKKPVVLVKPSLRGRRRLLEVIHPAFAGGEPLVLNEHLVDDAAEVGAAAAVPGPLHRLDNVGDFHRLSAGFEDLLDGVVEALLVAGAAIAASAAAQPTLDFIDLPVQCIELPLEP